MAQFKKILISLPDNLLKEIDSLVTLENTNRSEFVRKATILYIREKKKLEMREMMKKGYKEMAEINLHIAESCIDADNELQDFYENRLGEME